MTIDWNVDNPVPPRPAAPDSGRRRPRFRWSPPRRQVPGSKLAWSLVGAAVVITLAFGACGVLVGELDSPPRSVSPLRGVEIRPSVHSMKFRWEIDRIPDPTTMVVDGDDAFVVEPASVLSVRIVDGSTQWIADVKDADPYIAVNRDTILVGAVDGFEALERATGASRWRVTIEDPNDRGRTVGLVDTTRGVVAIGTTDHGGLVAIDAATGESIWSVKIDGTPHGPLVTDDQTGLVALRMERGGRVELRMLDIATGSQRWATSLGLMTGLPLFDGSRLVLDTGDVDDHGTVVAFDVASGRRIWETEVASSSEADQGAIVDGPNVVVVDGVGTVSALDRETGEARWSTDLPRPVFHGRPVAVERVLMFRDIFGAFHVIDRRTGALQGEFMVAGGFAGFGAGPSGLVIARNGTIRGQVVGLPRGMITMPTVGRAERGVKVTATSR